MNLAWLTDIHLNFLPPRARACFYATIATLDVDAVLITGDIGESDSTPSYLREMAEYWKKPL